MNISSVTIFLLFLHVLVPATAAQPPFPSCDAEFLSSVKAATSLVKYQKKKG